MNDECLIIGFSGFVQGILFTILIFLFIAAWDNEAKKKVKR